MKYQSKHRKALALRYADIYKLAPCERHSGGEYAYPLCVYCGDPADTIDHVPPLSRVDDYRSLRLEKETYLLVRSCRECNAVLGESLQTSVLERYELAKEKIALKAKPSKAMWTEEDMAELGPNMRRYVSSETKKRERNFERLMYVGGLRALLGFTEIGDKNGGQLCR